MSVPNKTTGITAEERRLRNERLRSRLMGICEGFDTGANADIKVMQDELGSLEQQLAAKDAEIADLNQQLESASRQIEQEQAIAVQAQRQLEEERKDAERLNWLAKERLYEDFQLGWIPSLYPHGWKLFGDTLREAIDAAREPNNVKA